jgi:hypothetical protein
MGEEAGDNTNDPNSPIHIYLESASGRVALEQGKGTGLKTLYLTDDKVKLTKLIFTKIIKVRKDINPAANLVTVSGTNTDVMLNGYKCIRVGSNHVCDTLYGNILQSDNAAQGRLAGELDKSKIPYVDGPEVINIDLAMNYNSTSPYKQFTKNFSLGVSKAKAAVFDTTLTPSTSSAKIGTSTNRWDVYGNTVDTTNLTVGSGSTLGYIYKGTFSYTIPVGGIAANDISAIVAGHGITVPAAGGFTPSNSIVIVTQNDGVFSHAIDPMFNLRVNSAGTNLIGWATNPSKTNGLIAGQIYNFNYMIMR